MDVNSVSADLWMNALMRFKNYKDIPQEMRLKIINHPCHSANSKTGNDVNIPIVINSFVHYLATPISCGLI